MPKTPKTKLKQPALPALVQATGNPWETSSTVQATVPLPNDVVITKIEGPYTERDRKLWAFLVAAVWDDLGIPKIHEIRVAKINAVFEQLGGDTSSGWLWDSARRLSRTIVEWTEGADGSRIKGFGVSSMLSANVSQEARATGRLRFEIPALLGEVIKNPCRFSRLRLHFMIGLSGKYAVTLYMLLESVANMDTPVLDIALPQLRQWLKVPEGKLNRWVDIKRFAIDPALKQINENPEAAGFSVAMEEIKEGRAVARARFAVAKTPARRAAEESRPPAQAGAAAYVLPTSAYGQAKKAAPGWDVYELERQWREWMADKPAPDNPSGAFVNFCKAKAQKTPGADARPQPAASASAAAKRAEAEKAERQWSERERACAWFEALPEEDQKALERIYLAESNPVDVGGFKKKGHAYIGFRFFVSKAWRAAG